ncbi:MAG TPA: EamA family transporter [Prevotella sp.]|nr:EamA family transporter [Prevotella sp.]
MNSRIKGFMAGILAAIFYGTNPLGTLPLYSENINSESVLFYRYGMAVVIFVLWMLLRGESFRIKWGEAIRFAVLGTFFALSSVTLYLSFHYINAGVASTILFSYPIMTALLMVLFFHERVTWSSTVSIILAVGGIALLYRGNNGVTLSGAGLILVLMSSLLYAIYIVSVSQMDIHMSPLKFTFWIVFFGLIAILFFSIFTGRSIQMLHGAKAWICGFQLALLPTVLSLYFMTIAIKNIGSTPSSIIGALEPVTAVVISCSLFSEVFTFRLFMGIVLILSAVILIILRQADSSIGVHKKTLSEN